MVWWILICTNDEFHQPSFADSRAKAVPWSPFLPAEARCPMGRVWQRAYRRHHYPRWEERHWHSPGKIHPHQPQERPLVSSPGFGEREGELKGIRCLLVISSSR